MPTARIARSMALAALLLQPPDVQAQGAEAARFARMTAAARAQLARAGSLWDARLDGVAWLGVEGQGPTARAHLTADPAAPGFAREGTLWSGALPAGVNPANSALAWGGRRWAMVLLPLPDDSARAVRLLIHEAMHALQDSAGGVLPLPRYSEGGDGSDLLDRPDGRLWLQLEWRALAAALRARGDAQRRAADDALLFRARRLALATANERRRERALDVREGLPEYTAWAVTSGTTRAAARDLATRMGDAEAAPSFVRSFAYTTGPAYGLLLDARSPGWRRRLRRAGDAASLQLELAHTLRGASPWMARALANSGPSSADSLALARRADAAASRYDGERLRAREAARWAARQRELADLRARFVDGPALRLRPRSLQIVFDPGGQTPLGAAGTVMRGFVWTGPDGAELRAPDGALVSADWQEVRVPLGDVMVQAGAADTTRRWRGAGWTLVLPAGWRAAADGGSWVLTPP